MTYLELLRSACVNCGLMETQNVTTAIPSVTSATGSIARVASWLNDCWTSLQMDNQNWDWMRSSNILRLSGTAPLGNADAGVSFATVAGQATYPLGTGAGTVGIDPEAFTEWVEGTFWNFTTATGYTDEIPMGMVPFDAWRAGWMSNASRNAPSRPSVIAIGPDKSLNVGPPSNGNYTITGDYFVAPSSMVNDTDVPVGLPTRYHMLIVYRVMIKAGYFESAAEMLQGGNYENDGMYAQLLAQYGPRFRTVRALA